MLFFSYCFVFMSSIIESPSHSKARAPSCILLLLQATPTTSNQRQEQARARALFFSERYWGMSAGPNLRVSGHGTTLLLPMLYDIVLTFPQQPPFVSHLLFPRFCAYSRILLHFFTNFAITQRTPYDAVNDTQHLYHH